MKYKIFCSDLDGTLLTTKSDVSDFTISEIARIKEQLKIFLVSARMPQSMTYLQKRLGIENQPIICYNGALVLDGTNEILSISIKIEAVEKVYELAKVEHIKLGLYYNSEWYVEETSERVEKEIKYTCAEPIFRDTNETIADWKSRNISAHKIMLMGTKESADKIYPLLTEQLSEQMNIYRSNDTLIELAPKAVSKLSAIKLLLSADESLSDVISFGDNYNDTEMLLHTGCGVAVANAREEVKSIANHITLKNTEDGVAHFIKQHLI
ncbi:HAD family phosphatase [Aurantibacter crassamenti]|uniref:Cof-type HAD-IIB family hydrolase n=1 Tax=Aurantibacter crassamenti TaxID=1837375 RepID=UPI0019392AD3|nr:Cof-type HAD-IIB family hydrolase [Aurantibacter crassamenti]MBM1107951.1 HAD family phosphatase [Aurantibacter crassamenti]